jgi:hypothetical protein
MPTPTYTALATVTLGTTASSITFSSIPATYRDLVVVLNGTVTNNTDLRVRYNGDTGSNYSKVHMWGQNSSGQSDSSTGDNHLNLRDVPGSARLFTRVQIMDYSATDKHKTALALNTYDPSSFTYNLFTGAGRWANTSAITSILVFLGTGNFNSGTTLSLYGITA